ncbi:hypothetical protein CYMTET_16410, partial [Cymbomonas tetramitiformis]
MSQAPGANGSFHGSSCSSLTMLEAIAAEDASLDFSPLQTLSKGAVLPEAAPVLPSWRQARGVPGTWPAPRSEVLLHEPATSPPQANVDLNREHPLRGPNMTQPSPPKDLPGKFMETPRGVHPQTFSQDDYGQASTSMHGPRLGKFSDQDVGPQDRSCNSFTPRQVKQPQRRPSKHGRSPSRGRPAWSGSVSKERDSSRSRPSSAPGPSHGRNASSPSGGLSNSAQAELMTWLLSMALPLPGAVIKGNRVCSLPTSRVLVQAFRSGLMLCNLVAKLDGCHLSGINPHPKTFPEAVYNYNRALHVLRQVRGMPRRWLWSAEMLVHGDADAVWGLVGDLHERYRHSPVVRSLHRDAKVPEAWQQHAAVHLASPSRRKGQSRPSPSPASASRHPATAQHAGGPPAGYSARAQTPQQRTTAAAGSKLGRAFRSRSASPQ